MLPQVLFRSNPTYDEQIILHMAKQRDPMGTVERLQSMGLSGPLATALEHNPNDPTLVQAIHAFVETAHTQHADTLNYAQHAYQCAWDTIHTEFFSRTTKLTHQPWRHDSYIVMLSPIHRGISSRDGCVVARSAFEDAEDQKRITAHELFMTHVWSCIDQRLSKDTQYDEHRAWMLNELITTATLGFDDELTKLWTTKTQGYDGYLHNYPELVTLKPKVRTIYKSNDWPTAFQEIWHSINA